MGQQSKTYKMSDIQQNSQPIFDTYVFLPMLITFSIYIVFNSLTILLYCKLSVKQLIVIIKASLPTAPK